jgi:hypothetical protein
MQTEGITSFVSRSAIAVAATALSLALALVQVPSASADVLISVPKSRVCVGHPFKVGVWYQSYSGGPRAYRIDVYGPNGHKVFHRAGNARGNWRYWRVPTTRLGRYKTVYHASSRNGPWKDTEHTRATRC